jgi:hypothetical protein
VIPYGRGGQIFQSLRRHLKILGARRVTWSKCHTEDSTTFRATLQNLVARNLCTPALRLVLRCVWRLDAKPLARSWVFTVDLDTTQGPIWCWNDSLNGRSRAGLADQKYEEHTLHEVQWRCPALFYPNSDNIFNITSHFYRVSQVFRYR